MENKHYTHQAYSPLQDAYDFFNAELFEGKLPGAIITLNGDNPKSGGYYRRNAYVSENKEVTDEICMNPRFFAKHPIEYILSILVHEAVHQYQDKVLNDPPRRGYHDKTFANLMEDVGLIASTNSSPGGKKTGQKMGHYILEGGLFIRTVKKLLETKLKLNWYDTYPIENRGFRFVYPENWKPEIARNPINKIIDVESIDEDDGDHDFSENENGFIFEVLRDEEEECDGIDLSGLEDDEDQDDGLTKPLIIEGIDEIFKENQPKESTKTREKFSCPSCKDNLWGKKTLEVLCQKCNEQFVIENN